MDISRINKKLADLYDEGNRIVFWYDDKGEFEELLGHVSVPDTTIIRLDQSPALEVKVRIEQEQPDTRFLLYSPMARPSMGSNWLLDIELYSRVFRADKASILLTELGLVQQAMREHLSQRGKFFANKDRLNRLKRFVRPEDSAVDLDRKIIAVLARSTQVAFFTILTTVFSAIPDGDPDVSPGFWGDLKKYDVEDSFWALVKKEFAYEEQKPSLKGLLIRLMVSDFAHGLAAELPDELGHLVLSKRGMANSAVLLAQWRDSTRHSGSYDLLSGAIAELIHIENHLANYSADALGNVETFMLCERHILSLQRNFLLTTRSSINVSAMHQLSRDRRDSYWASGSSNTPEAPRAAFNSAYRALNEAAEFFVLLNQYQQGFSFSSSEEALTAYTTELFWFDSRYRRFCEFADHAEAEGWDLLKSLRDAIEDAYLNGYLNKLAYAWGDQLEAGLIDSWQIKGVNNQYDFYRQEVEPITKRGEDRRVYVIISDAFRYEAAQEMATELNGQYRISAELGHQLGVLPSYTSLGMAALLPGTALAFNEKAEVSMDGKSCAGFERRKSILEAVGGTAIKYDDIMAMSKTAGREAIKPYQTIYIYHDTIDAIGDKQATEAHTFDATRRAIRELADLTRKIINSFNGQHILVTADHGFLFQESAPTVTTKNTLDMKPTGTIIAKKRYILGHDFSADDKVYRGSTSVTAKAAGDLDFWVPKGINRFHFVGGSRFVHGGAMPQEVVVPILRVIQQRGSRAAATRVKSVGVSVLGANYKITTNRHIFKLIQSEAVSERVRALSLKVAIYDGAEPVSNVETVTLDSKSKVMNDWQRVVTLTLVGRTFDKSSKYQLVLRNTDTGVDEARFDVSIDLAFSNDF